MTIHTGQALTDDTPFDLLTDSFNDAWNEFARINGLLIRFAVDAEAEERLRRDIADVRPKRKAAARQALVEAVRQLGAYRGSDASDEARAVIAYMLLRNATEFDQPWLVDLAARFVAIGPRD